jgi:hypothetical protein
MAKESLRVKQLRGAKYQTRNYHQGVIPGMTKSSW